MTLVLPCWVQLGRMTLVPLSSHQSDQMTLVQLGRMTLVRPCLVQLGLMTLVPLSSHQSDQMTFGAAGPDDFGASFFSPE